MKILHICRLNHVLLDVLYSHYTCTPTLYIVINTNLCFIFLDKKRRPDFYSPVSEEFEDFFRIGEYK